MAPLATARPAAVVYEVNLDVDATIRTEYLAWLGEHIAQICALPGFAGASLFEVLDPGADPGRANFCVQYRLIDHAALETYLSDHAPGFRADGLARFGDRFRASRRVMRRLD